MPQPVKTLWNCKLNSAKYISLKASKLFKLGVYEWCWTSDFNPLDQTHCNLGHLLEDSMEICRRGPTGRMISTALQALERSHFRIIESQDLTKNSSRPSSVPWFETLKGALASSTVNWPVIHASGKVSKESASILIHAGIFSVSTSATSNSS